MAQFNTASAKFQNLRGTRQPRRLHTTRTSILAAFTSFSSSNASRDTRRLKYKLGFSVRVRVRVRLSIQIRVRVRIKVGNIGYIILHFIKFKNFVL